MSLAFRPTGPFTPAALPPTLQSFIGYWPSQLNCFPIGWKTDGNTVYGIANDFTQWNSNTHVSLSTVASFDGQVCVNKITPDTTNNWHIFSDTFGVCIPAAPHVQRLAIIARPDGYSRLQVTMQSFSDANLTCVYNIDFGGPNIGYSNTIGSHITIVQQHVQVLTGSWVLAYIDFFINNSANYGNEGSQTLFQFIRVDNGTGTGTDNVTFTGDGTSGIDVLMVSMLPIVLWNNTFSTTPMFADEFTDLSGIDLNNTHAPGFRWYLDGNNFANSVYTTFGWVSKPPSVASRFTIPAKSILRIWESSPGSNGAYQNTLTSVTSDGGNGYIGTAHPTTQIRDCLLTYNGTYKQVLNPNWSGDGPTFWGDPVPPLLPAGTDNSLNSLNNYSFTEWDTYLGNQGMNDATLTPGIDRYYREIGGSEFINWSNPASPGVSTSPPSASITSNLALGRYFRATSVWVNSFADPTAPGYGALYTFSDGAGFPVRNSSNLFSYFRNGKIGQSEFYNYWVQIYSTGIDSPNPDGLFGQPSGGQQSYWDWVRIYGPNNPVTCYNLWDQYDKDSNLIIDPTAVVVTKTSGGSAWGSVRGSGVGKKAGLWYWELTLTGTVATSTSVMLGIMSTSATVSSSNPGATSKGAGIASTVAANTNVSGVTGKTASSLTFAANDVISFALDMTAGIVYIAQNNVWLNGAPGSGNGVWGGLTSADRWYPAVAIHDTSGSPTITANFGGAAFVYGLPSGYTGWVLPP